MLPWLEEHETLVWSLSIISAITFFGTLLLLPILILRLPADYFVHRPVRDWPARRSAAHVLLVLAKNLLGFVLLLTAIAMLVLPGQGLLMMLVGIMLLDFPGKGRLERWLVMRKPVCRTANWIRTKRGRPPLQLPSEN